MKNIRTLVMSASLLFATPVLAVDTDAVLGGAIGGGVGAAVGSEVGGREGAIAGGAIGAAVGTAIATKDDARKREHRNEREPENTVVYVESRGKKKGPPGHAYGYHMPPGHAKHKHKHKHH